VLSKRRLSTCAWHDRLAERCSLVTLIRIRSDNGVPFATHPAGAELALEAVAAREGRGQAREQVGIRRRAKVRHQCFAPFTTPPHPPRTADPPHPPSRPRCA